MAQIPKGRLVENPLEKPICSDCAMYFSSTVYAHITDILHLQLLDGTGELTWAEEIIAEIPLGNFPVGFLFFFCTGDQWKTKVQGKH